MNPTERDLLRQELLEAHFGCHPDPDALEARLAADPERQALAAEVRREAGLLTSAAKDAPPLAAFIPPPASLPAQGQRLRRFAPFAAAAAAVLLLTPVVAWWWSGRGTAPEPAAAIRVVAAAERVPGSGYALDVAATDAQGRDTQGSFTWQARDASGATLAAATLSTVSTHPATPTRRLFLEDSARVAEVAFVEETSGLKLDFSLPGEERNGGPLVHLTTCRPVYAPGDAMHWRAVVLDSASRDAVTGSLVVRLVDPANNVVQTWNENLEDGVVAGVWIAAAIGGRYALEVRSRADDFSYAKLDVLVREFQAPRFETIITLDRATYAPGARGQAEIELRRFDGAPLGTVSVDASLVVDGQPGWSESARADSGRVRFGFTVPAVVERGDAVFTVRVNGGDVVETAVKSFVVPLGRLDVTWYPEGGEWPVGFRTRLYAEVRDPLGRPADLKGRIVDDANREIAAFATEHQGRGHIELAAEAGRRYRLVVDEPKGVAESELPLPVAGAIALRARSDAFPAGEPLVFDVETPNAGPWLLAAYARDRFVGHAFVHGSGRHDVGIALPAEIAGVLRVTAFDAAGRPVAERLVARRSARELSIDVEPQAAELPPGAPQKLTVRVRDPEGRPVMAILGLAVHDAADWSVADRSPVGIVDTAWLLGDVEELERVQDFLADDAASRRNVDLLLGTRGWRRFAWRDPAAFVAAHGDAARRALARDGVAQRPRIAYAARPTAAPRSMLARLGVGPCAAAAVGLFGVVALLGRSRGAALAGGVAALAAIGILAVVSSPVVAVEGLAGLSSAVPPSGHARTEIVGPPLPPNHAVPNDPGVLLAFSKNLDLSRVARDQFFFFGVPVSRSVTLLHVAGAAAAPLDAIDLFEEIVPPGDPAELDVGFVRAWTDTDLRHLLEFSQFARVYAHVHAKAADRQDFAATLYWNALLRTDANGVATVEFQTSDRLTTFDVRVDAHGARRLGQARTSFRTKLPLHVEASLPVALSGGDRLLVPLGVGSDDPLRRKAKVTLAAHGALRSEGALSEEIELEQGRGRRLVPVVADESKGTMGVLIASAEHGGVADSQRREVPIVPRGFPRTFKRSGNLERTAEAVVPAPEEAVPGSVRASLKVYPSALSSLEDGLDGMLAEPGGCFEQTSSRNYPNVLALTLLRSLGDGSPALEARAKRHLETGYRLLTSYECKTGGFEWFGKDPGHAGLTAYGLLQFHDMAAVYDVDRAMMERTRRWLLGLRDGQGGFRANQAGLHSWRMDATDIANAYLGYALLATGTDPKELGPELDRLATRVATTADAYELAVAAVALGLGGRPEAATARARLGTMQREDGAVVGASTSITGSGGTDLLVETTSFAALAWLSDRADRAKVDQAFRWILEQRSGTGIFGATQATVMALKTLCAVTSASRPTATDGTLRVFVNGALFAERTVFAGDHKVVRIEGLDGTFVAGDNRVRLEVEGRSDLTWALDYAYRSKVPADDTGAKVALAVGLAAPEAVEGATVGVTATVRNVTDEALPMVMAVVGLPAGLKVDAAVLDGLKAAGRIDFWELLGRELVLYWRGLGPNEVRVVAFDAVAAWPGDTTGRASRVLLYYTPESTAWAAPVGLAIRPLR